MRMVHFVFCILLIAVGACGKKPPVVQPTVVKVIETVEVKVPVPFKVAPPAELMAPLQVDLPVFVSPSDPAASSALTVENERKLRALIETLMATVQAWRVWATTPAPPP